MKVKAKATGKAKTKLKATAKVNVRARTKVKKIFKTKGEVRVKGKVNAEAKVLGVLLGLTYYCNLPVTRVCTSSRRFKQINKLCQTYLITCYSREQRTNKRSSRSLN